MKKTIIPLFIVLLLLSTSVIADEDWRIAVFDKIQLFTTDFESKESEIMQLINPDTAKCYEVLMPFRKSVQRVEKYVFLKKLQENPKSINWEYSQLLSLGSSSIQEMEKLAGIDAEFNKLYEDYLKQKENLRMAGEYTKLRNKIYYENRLKFIDNERMFEYKLRNLHTEIKKLANKSPKPTPTRTDFTSKAAAAQLSSPLYERTK